MNPSVWVDFQPLGRRVQVDSSRTLLDAARAAGVALTAVCGGAGVCGACRVRLVTGELSAPGAVEVEALGMDRLQKGFRLACLARPLADVRIEIPPESLSSFQRLQVEGLDNGFESDMDDPFLELPGGIPPLGLALDLGSTKLAAYLMDLQSRRILARAGAVNPQIPYGEDVVSRIAYANQHPEGRHTLQRLLVEQVQALAEQLCTEAGQPIESILRVAAVGNTVIHHLFCGLPVHQLGVAPYVPAVMGALEFPAENIGLHFAPNAGMYLPPNIAGFVGADHVAMLIGCGLGQVIAGREDHPPVVAVDIGTNTEISLYAGGRQYCCSCASGPTFEGAHITDGMRAAPGAVEHIQVRGDVLYLQTIDQLPAVGICGSGILDGVAALLDLGVVDRRGVLRGNHPRLEGAGKAVRFVLANASESGTGAPVSITRADVNEVQLAKAAIRAGLEVLLDAARLDANDLAEIIIAGAFGTYLDVRSAVRVGMFPLLPLERFRQVGNAAGTGARSLLCSSKNRRLAASLAAQAEYVELTTSPRFRDLYIDALVFENQPINPGWGQKTKE